MRGLNSVYIPRRIYNRLKSIYTEKLTVVCAPENYGKTTLLYEFIKRSRPDGSSCRFITGSASANECFERYCEMVLGYKEHIPITENDYQALCMKFSELRCDKPFVIVIDAPSAESMVLNHLYCFRLIMKYSPANIVITCEDISFHYSMLIERHRINLISKDELLLTIKETEDYLKRRGVENADAALIHSNVQGEALRTRLCADLFLRGELAQSYELYSLLYHSVIKLLPRQARFAALCVCAFNIIDEQTCANMRSEPDIVEYYGSDDITLATITEGIEKINHVLPNLWVSNQKVNYSPPEFAKKIVSRGFKDLPAKIKNAFLRCCAKDYLRCGKVFTAICQYCAAGEYEIAASLPTQGIVAFDYILIHKDLIYEIVTSIPLSCKPMIPRLVRMVAMLMLTDYKERVRYLFRDIIAYVSASDDYTESERNDTLCYTHALRMYEEFYLIEKMGVHIKSAYELYSGTTAFDPPFYSWSLYTPSVFALLYQYSIPTATQFEQFTRYHRMYTEMVKHGECIEAVYIAEMYYYMGDLRKSLSNALDVIESCSTAEKFIPTGLIAHKTVAKCALLTGNCELYNDMVTRIADIAKKYSSTEVGDMAHLTLAMLACLRCGNDEDVWQVISQEDSVIERNRYTTPFYYYIRCCYMLIHKEYALLLQRSEKYIKAATEVRNETMELMIKLTVATAYFLNERPNEAMQVFSQVLDALENSEMIMPVVELCINFPAIFRYAAGALANKHSTVSQKILDIAKPYIENIETLRTQELTEQSIANMRSAKITECESKHSAVGIGANKKLKLTKQALRYAVLAADGFSNTQISEMTGASTDSVKSSLKRTYSKLGVSSRAKLKSVLSEIT